MKPTVHSSNAPATAADRLDRPALGGALPAWRSRSAIAALCTIFVLVQLLVPAAQLIWAARPARFGWQMFSVSAPPPDFAIELRDGTTEPLDIKPYVVSLRGDVPLAQFLPPHVCRVVPGVVAVRYRLPGALHSEAYQCTH